MSAPSIPSADLAGEGLEAYTVSLLADLALWAGRDDSEAQPEVTRAGYDAVTTIDALTGDLHRLRVRLVDELHQREERSIARVDWLLRQRDGES